MPDPTPSSAVPPIIPVNLSQVEVAAYLGIGRRKVVELTLAREIPHFRIGRRVLYPRADIDRWQAEQVRQTARRR